ncbi:MAG TPA: DNA-formamidopyrimidine glycosylase family protein [Polyangia bacterium]|jgi:formamidopyrimidine-DNA glycosylase
MPELPDLAYVESVLRPALGGRRIVGARTGDPLVLRVMVTEPFPAVLIGRTFTDVSRRGHFMRFALDDELVLVVNAMLAGRYRLFLSSAGGAAGSGDGEGRKRDPRALGLAVTLDDGVELQYVDDKRMGKVYVARAADEKQIPVYGKLGLDVLSPAFTREAFGRVLSKRRDQARMFLMDKSALASIGNAYADEILFAARIHPKTFCNKLSPADADTLYAAIPSVLRTAIDEIARRAEPIDVKVRDFLKVRGRDGKPCPNCSTTLRAVRVGDGDACFCPTCQPTGRKLFVDFRGLSRGEVPATAPVSVPAVQPVTPARRKKST